MEINDKIEFLNERLEKEEELRKEQLDWEEKFRIEQLQKKGNYAWEKWTRSKGSLTETWHLKGWRWNKKLKGGSFYKKKNWSLSDYNLKEQKLKLKKTEDL